MRRRALLRRVPAVAGAASAAGSTALAGCLDATRPEVRMDSGTGLLHPASELHVANGLQPDGDDDVFVTPAADVAPDLVGPDAHRSLADDLENQGGDRFHVVVQLRSTPAAPMDLWPAPGGAFAWPERSTLRVAVAVGPWGPLDRIDDDERREALESAETLVFSAVWSLTPAVDELPEDVELVLESRD